MIFGLLVARQLIFLQILIVPFLGFDVVGIELQELFTCDLAALQVVDFVEHLFCLGEVILCELNTQKFAVLRITKH